MCTQQQGQKRMVSGQIAMLVLVAVCSGSRREYCLERAQSKHEQQQVMVLFTFVTLPTEAALNNTTVYNLQSKVRYNFTKKREASCQRNPSYIQCLFFQMTASLWFFLHECTNSRQERKNLNVRTYVTQKKETKKLSSISQLKESHNWGLCDGHSYTSWPNGPFFQRLVRRRSQVGFLLLAQTLLSSFFQLRLLCHDFSR